VGEVKRYGLNSSRKNADCYNAREESGKRSAQASKTLSCRHDKKGTKHRQWCRCAAVL